MLAYVTHVCLCLSMYVCMCYVSASFPPIPNRIRMYEEALRESNLRVESLRRDKEEAYQQLNHLQMQFTLWKSHQVGR